MDITPYTSPQKPTYPILLATVAAGVLLAPASAQEKQILRGRVVPAKELQVPDPDAKYIAIALTQYEEYTSQSTYDKITTQWLTRAETAQRVRDKKGKRGNEAALPPGLKFIHVRISTRAQVKPHLGGGTFHAFIDPATCAIIDSYRDR